MVSMKKTTRSGVAFRAIALWILGCRNGLEFETLSIPFGNSQGASLPLRGFQEIWIVISFAVDAFPGENRVVPGGNAAQTEPSTLIGNGFAITIRAVSPARFRNRDDDRVGQRFS